MILGAFAAGAVLTLADRDEVMTHPIFRLKLEAIGFGLFIPVFFVASGLRFDLNALLDDPSNLAMVPVFLAGARWSCAACRRCSTGRLSAPGEPPSRACSRRRRCRSSWPRRRSAATLDMIGGAESAELIAAGLLSVLLFPLAGSLLLRGDVKRNGAPADIAPKQVLLVPKEET